MSVVISSSRPLPVQPHLAASEFLIVERTAARPQALEMGCHTPWVSQDRPAVSLGVQVWAFGSIFLFVVGAAGYWLATH